MVVAKSLDWQCFLHLYGAFLVFFDGLDPLRQDIFVVGTCCSLKFYKNDLFWCFASKCEGLWCVLATVNRAYRE